MSIRSINTDPGADSWMYFDVHGRARMRVARSAGAAAQLALMFRPFLVPGPFEVDLTVVGGQLELDDPSNAEDDLRFTARGLDLVERRVQLEYREDGIWLYGESELLTFVLPLIDRIAAEHGAAMIHAATLAINGVGVALPAWGGVGKTSAVAKLASDPSVEFFGDDWAFVADTGELLGYAKPMLLKPYHRKLFPHVFAKKRKVLAPSRLARPLGRLATRLHPILTRYPRLTSLLRRYSPEYILVHPSDALPTARIGTVAPLGLLLFVERYAGDSPLLERRDERWMVGRLTGNFYFALPKASREFVEALGATGLIPLDTAFGRKAAVLERGIAGLPCYLLRVPVAASADEASQIITNELHTLLAETRVRRGIA